MTIKEIFAGESDNLEFKEEIPTKSEKFMKTVLLLRMVQGED